MPVFNEKSMNYLRQGMDAASLRQDVIANNLANLNTPGFNRSTVSFEDELQKARQQQETSPLEKTHPRHLPAPGGEVEPQVKEDTSTVRRIDENNVDIEKEMLSLVNNQLRFNTMSQQVSDRLNTWQYVINEGRF